MKKIYKYNLEVTDEQDITIPMGARILSVAEQRTNIVLYALVDPEAPPTLSHISIRGTGHDSDNLEDKRFLGTVNLCSGSLMFHVFLSE